MSEQPTTKELAAQLAEPMTYRWRVKTFFHPDHNKSELKAGRLPTGTKGQFLAYIESRDVYDRMDQVFGPGQWQDSFSPLNNDDHSVEVGLGALINDRWVWKYDVGYPNNPGSDKEEEPFKAAVSDGIKRAGIHWGIGRFLYSLDPVWVEVDKWGKPLKPINDNPEAHTVDEHTGEVTEPKRAAADAPARAATGHTNGKAPACPVCGGEMWDNRDRKTNPKAPDFKCKDKTCDGVVWPPKIHDPKEDVGSQSLKDELGEYFPGAKDLPFDQDPEMQSLYSQEGR